MSTLGERLAARETREAKDKTLKLARENNEELRIVQRYFEDARETIIADISNEVPVRRITLGQRGDTSGKTASILQTYQWHYNIQKPGKSIEHPDHPYYPVWEGFKQWANSEGLEVKFTYEYDTGGVESWHVLNVKASVATPT